MLSHLVRSYAQHLAANATGASRGDAPAVRHLFGILPAEASEDEWREHFRHKYEGQEG